VLLLEALVASSSNTNKGFLLQWIKDASAEGSLGHLANLDYTETDLEITRKVFPRNSELKDLNR
jgi:hypothetical protein